jgi:hypothetical protein
VEAEAPSVGVRTIVDRDAGEDVGGLTIDNGAISWNDPWISYERLSFYVTEDRIVVKDGGRIATCSLGVSEYVNAYLAPSDGLHFIVEGPGYTTQLVYANGWITLRRTIVHPEGPFSTYRPETTPKSWYSEEPDA